MRPLLVFSFRHLVVLSLLLLLSCGRAPDRAAEVGSTPVPTSNESADAGYKSESNPATNDAASTSISGAEVSAITGIEYSESSQPADFPNIKQWEFQGGANSVSLIVASGKTALERMTDSKLVSNVTVDSYLDEALWEPIRGRLAARSGEQYVEVRLSKSHGSEDQRIEFARKLGTLLLDRY